MARPDNWHEVSLQERQDEMEKLLDCGRGAYLIWDAVKIAVRSPNFDPILLQELKTWKVYSKRKEGRIVFYDMQVALSPAC